MQAVTLLLFKKKKHRTESRQGGDTQKGRMILPESSWPEVEPLPPSVRQERPQSRPDPRHHPSSLWAPWALPSHGLLPFSFPQGRWPAPLHSTPPQSPGRSLEPRLRGDGPCRAMSAARSAWAPCCLCRGLARVLRGMGKLATLELEDSSGGAVFSLAEDQKQVLDGILQPLSSGADPSSGLEVPLPPGGQWSVPR